MRLSPDAANALADELAECRLDAAYLSRRLVQANSVLDDLRLFIEREQSDAAWDYQYEKLRDALRKYDRFPAK